MNEIHQPSSKQRRFAAGDAECFRVGVNQRDGLHEIAQVFRVMAGERLGAHLA